MASPLRRDVGRAGRPLVRLDSAEIDVEEFLELDEDEVKQHYRWSRCLSERRSRTNRRKFDQVLTTHWKLRVKGKLVDLSPTPKTF